MQNNSKKYGKFGKMTGRVEFNKISTEVKNMLNQQYSIKYIFNHFSEKKDFTQSYQTFLRYIHKYKDKNISNIKNNNDINNTIKNKNIIKNEIKTELSSKKYISKCINEDYKWKEMKDGDGNIRIIGSFEFGKYCEKITNTDGTEQIIKLSKREYDDIFVYNI